MLMRGVVRFNGFMPFSCCGFENMLLLLIEAITYFFLLKVIFSSYYLLAWQRHLYLTRFVVKVVILLSLFPSCFFCYSSSKDKGAAISRFLETTFLLGVVVRNFVTLWSALYLIDGGRCHHYEDDIYFFPYRRDDMRLLLWVSFR